MAIIKHITLDNGVLVNYHRVVSVNNITNHATIIEVASYTDKEKRTEEKEKLANNEPMNIFIHSQYYNFDYQGYLSVDDAYDKIKQLDIFKGSMND